MSSMFGSTRISVNSLLINFNMRSCIFGREPKEMSKDFTVVLKSMSVSGNFVKPIHIRVDGNGSIRTRNVPFAFFNVTTKFMFIVMSFFTTSSTVALRPPSYSKSTSRARRPVLACSTRRTDRTIGTF